MSITSKDLSKIGIKNKELAIRQIREPILKKAWDAYKIAVCYGEIIETPEEHKQMCEWAQRLRDKDVSAFDNIPEKVKYYL